MKKSIISVVAVSALTAALTGCGFNTQAYDDKNTVLVPSSKVTYYDGRVITSRDLVIYRNDPRHVFVYDGVNYRVRAHNNTFVYYRI